MVLLFSSSTVLLFSSSMVLLFSSSTVLLFSRLDRLTVAPLHIDYCSKDTGS
jgi:hypothetical protein